MVTPCINNIQHFNNQLTHTTLKNVELLKYFKISKTAPTCFGLQGNHRQGATISTLLKITHLVKSRYVEAIQDVVSVYPHTGHGTHASHITICSHNTDNILYELYVSTFNQVCNF